MKKHAVAIIAAFVYFSIIGAGQNRSDWRLYDLRQAKEIPLSTAISRLEQKRIILVGEYHGDENHHRAQLAVIEGLFDAGARVAVGLEMFRSDSQQALDRWIAGTLDEQEFEKIYSNNWTLPWLLYRPIFEYAKAHKIPMIGLNVPMSITRQVAEKGFQSLSEKQKGQLSNITCRVDQEYMNYIRKAFGAHGHGDFNFTYFCEAQLVWDNAMAVNTLNFMKKHPDAEVVILTGIGHARKGAIPRQIRKRSEIPCAVILPQIKGVIDPATISADEADYIMFD